MSRVRGWGARVAGLLALLALATGTLPSIATAPAASQPARPVGLTVPGSPLNGTETFTATAAAGAGQTIASVAFQESPGGANSWSTFDTETTGPYTGTLDTTTLSDGVYDFRAVATDTAGHTYTSKVASDLTIVNNASYVAITSPGTPLSGTTTLSASAPAGGSPPDTITFEICPTSDDCPASPAKWKKLAAVTPQEDGNGNANAHYSLDTTTLGDGSYDIGVTAQDAAGDAFQGGAVSNLLVDNTPPTVSLQNPGGSMSGTATLDASAQDASSGLDAVRFEAAPAGSGQWKGIGAASSPPYSMSFDTRQLSDGSYDLRAIAVDNAGNTATSAVVGGVTISNPGAQPFGGLSITTYQAPASNIRLLGEIPGGQHETWAVGQTSAPPPTVNGSTLPYTAQGSGQAVLLSYTDASGWQIADVLRNADGSAYPLPAGGKVTISGQMTASGEAWLVLKDVPPAGSHQQQENAVFHRVPGGQFKFDASATSTLLPLVRSGTFTMRLGQTSSGAMYGVLTSPTAPSSSQTVSSPDGPVTVTTQLAFAQLVNGVWSVQSPSLPGDYTAPSGVNRVTLATADVTGPGSGWAAIQQGPQGGGLILGRFDRNGWSFQSPLGLDALDLTGQLDPASPAATAAGSAKVVPVALRVDGTGLWLKATVTGGVTVFARYDFATGRVVDSWCGAPEGNPVPPGCAKPWASPDEPAAVPDAAFNTSDGVVADALDAGFIDVYYHGAWTSIAASGFGGGTAEFVDPTDGWLVGQNALARISATPPPSPLASWPEANRNPLLSVALPPGQSTTDTAGALAVGLNGTALSYDPTIGWQVAATPQQTHHIQLSGVAFAGPSLAFAVGLEGTILRWNGTAWSEDPQSVQLTTATLNAVAFDAAGQGWAVGARGTILHYDGSTWSPEQIDGQDSGSSVTSVATAGNVVYAIAGGNLIMRTADGVWQRVPAQSLPSPAPPVGALRLVSGLADGGIVVAGKSLLMTKDSSSASFTYSPQTFNGIPVALAAFRGPGGDLRAYVSIAPPIRTDSGLSDDVGGFPAGDGNLLLESDSGWEDLSHDLPASSVEAAPGDGVVQPDPVLAVAASSDGSHAWAVGGYAGTHAADGVGTDQLLSARPGGWLTSSIWRYDAGGSASSPTSTEAPVSLSATPNNVSFAFFSSSQCKSSCAQVQNAQPDVNLTSAAGEIAAFAQQPGGPAFAMFGGNARGSLSGNRASPLDLARLPRLLSPLSGVPTYAAYGPLDAASSGSDPSLPWAEAFGSSPAPFGPGAAPAGIVPQGAGDPSGSVDKYYAFDVTQNGGTLRAIVLDNSSGSLEASAPGQSAWLSNELDQAQAAGLPIVVFAAEPLNVNDLGAASDADAVASQLAAAGVIAVFTTSGGTTGGGQNVEPQQDQLVQVPADAGPGTPTVPEYEGATLSYQQPNDNGALWYDVSIDTSSRTVNVQAIPVISSLALEPLNGLTANRSSTLSFQAVGRRPNATIATTPLDPSFPGYNQYVGIPSSNCSGCIGPSYSFTSSDPVVGDFVVPSAPGSPYPKLGADGKTTHSAKSGLFCAFNSGTTTVTVTSGLLSSSLPVTVNAGGYGPPCGTVPGGTDRRVISIGGSTVTQVGSNPGLTTPFAPITPAAASTPLPKISIPPAPPAPHPPVAVAIVHKPAVKASPTPHHPVAPVTYAASAPIPPASQVATPPFVPPLIPPALTPVPPGGATVSAQATAKREEKARKHASQSAFVARPAGVSGEDWFYPATAVAGVVTLLLIAGGLRPGPKQRLAFAEVRDPLHRRRA